MSLEVKSYGGPQKRFKKNPHKVQIKKTVRTEWLTQWGSSAKKNSQGPQKKKKKRPNKRELKKKGEDDCNVNQAPSMHAPFLTFTQQPLALSVVCNALENQLLILFLFE